MKAETNSVWKRLCFLDCINYIFYELYLSTLSRSIKASVYASRTFVFYNLMPFTCKNIKNGCYNPICLKVL